MNSFYQYIYMIPEMRQMFLGLDLDEFKAKEPWKVKILEGFKDLIVRMALLDAQSQSTEKMNEVFGWKDSEMMNQHDIQEAARIILNYIEGSFHETKYLDQFATVLQ